MMYIPLWLLATCGPVTSLMDLDGLIIPFQSRQGKRVTKAAPVCYHYWKNPISPSLLRRCQKYCAQNQKQHAILDGN